MTEEVVAAITVRKKREKRMRETERGTKELMRESEERKLKGEGGERLREKLLFEFPFSDLDCFLFCFFREVQRVLIVQNLQPLFHQQVR